MVVDFDAAAALRFAVALLRRAPPTAGSDCGGDVDQSLSTIVDGLTASSDFPPLDAAKEPLRSGVDALRRDLRAAASATSQASDAASSAPDLREAKERALDCLSTGLKARDRLRVVEFVVVAETLLFVASWAAAATAQDRIRCVQTTRRVFNVHLKKLHETREMLRFLVEKLCRHDHKSEVWIKGGLELEDGPPDVVADAEMTAFVKEVFIVTRHADAFLDFVANKLVAASPALVGQVVGPIRCPFFVKINVTEMTLDEAMEKLYRVMKDAEIKEWLGLKDEEEVELES